jgi:hypothetical protein
MPSIIDLIPEVWLIIADYLTLAELSLLSEAFRRSRARTVVSSICSSQAKLILQGLINFGSAYVTVQVRGDGQEILPYAVQSLEHKGSSIRHGHCKTVLSRRSTPFRGTSDHTDRGPKWIPFCAVFEKATKTLVTISPSQVTMKLSAGPFPKFYDPAESSAQPAEIFRATLRYLPENSGKLLHPEMVDLEYWAEKGSPPGTVCDSMCPP